MKKTSANIGLAIWRLKYFYETFVQGSTAVILLNFCAKNPPHRQAEKRYGKIRSAIFFNLSAKRIFCSLIQSSFFSIKIKNLSKFERFPFYKFVKIICFP